MNLTSQAREAFSRETIRVNIQGAGLPVGLRRIYAPEMDRPGGAKARGYPASWRPADSKIEMHQVEAGRHERVIAVTGPEGEWFTKTLMAAYGWPITSTRGCLKATCALRRHRESRNPGAWECGNRRSVPAGGPRYD